MGLGIRTSITRKMGLLMSMPAAGALLCLAVVYGYISATASNSDIINVAGRQRLLSQQLEAYAHMVSIGQDADREPLLGLVRDFDEALSALAKGGTVGRHVLPPPPPGVLPSLNKVLSAWPPYREALTIIAERPLQDPGFAQAYKFIRASTDQLTVLSDKLVDAYQDRQHRMHTQVLQLITGVVLLDILLLVAGVWLAKRYIVQPVLKVESAAQRLQSGDYSARVPVLTQDELAGLARAFNNMAIQLEQHNKALLQTQAANERQMTSLADANVRSVVLHDTLEQLRDAGIVLHQRGNFNKFYTAMLDSLMDITNASYGAFGIFDDQGGMRDFLVRGVTQAQIDAIDHWPVGKGLLRAVYEENKPLRVDNINRSPMAGGFPPGHPPMTSLIGVPISKEGVIKGVIYLADKDGGKPFSDDDMILLSTFVIDLYYVLEQHELLAALRRSNDALEMEKRQQVELIAELKDARNQLLQSEKLAAIGQLAAGVAHEINNPIGYISSNMRTLEGYVDNLITVIQAYEGAEDALQEQTELLQSIRSVKEKMDLVYTKEDSVSLLHESQEGIERVKKIVQDLKDFSRTGETAWQWADLHQGLDSTLNIVNNEIKYKAEVIKDYSALPEVECVPSQLNQVFMNMLVNAAHAIEEHGTITIRTSQMDEEWISIEISDTGKGIEKAHIHKLFDPFFTTKPVGKGTGLGLSLAHGIVKKHGGRIEVESEPGKGTTFRVVIPVKHTDSDSDAVDAA